MERERLVIVRTDALDVATIADPLAKVGFVMGLSSITDYLLSITDLFEMNVLLIKTTNRLLDGQMIFVAMLRNIE